MITFESAFERDFWCERFTYWEAQSKMSLRSPAEYADRCLEEFKERNSTPKEQLEKLKGSSFIEERCPSGLHFGNDCDTREVCDTCPIWGDCSAATAKNRNFLQNLGKPSVFPEEKCPYEVKYGMQYGVDAGKSVACTTCNLYQHCKDTHDFKNIKPV